jgi:peptidoglycan pentaglycine glycine transferase (the first glycine)
LRINSIKLQLVELSEKDKDIYSQFVINQSSGSFLQSWEWGQWQASLGREALRFFVIDDYKAGNLGCVQLIKMPLPFGRHYLYAPYGPVVGSRKSEVGDQILKELQKKFVDTVFIRIEPKDTLLISNFQFPIFKSSNVQPSKTLLIDLAKPDDQLLAEMHPKTRYNIKVAQKHGVEIKDEFDISVGHGLFAKEAVLLIAQTARRQGFKNYGTEYYNKMIDFFAVKNRGALKLHIYKAIYQDKILASAIMLDFPAKGGSASGGGTRTFLFGGSSDEYRNVMAPYLLHWQAMRDAKAQGMEVYDFWGTETSSGEVPGFVRFKLGFGGSERQYSGAYDFIVSKPWYRAYGLLRSVNKIIKKISSD